MDRGGQGWTGIDIVLLDSFSEIKVPLATSEQVSPRLTSRNSQWEKVRESL